MKSVREMIDGAVQTSSMERQITERHGIYFLTCGAQRVYKDHFLFLGGIHGDETSGPLGILRFVEQYAGNLPDCMITLVPFANEYGYMHEVRFDALGTDLNRIWDKIETSQLPLVEAMKQCVSEFTPTYVVTIHEDDEQTEHYAYTFLQQEHTLLFDTVWNNFSQNFPVFSGDELYGLEVDMGCIAEVVNDGSLEAVLFAKYGISTINLELTDSVPLEENIVAVQVFLTSLVDAFCAKRNVDSHR